MNRPQGEGWEPKSNFIAVGGGGTSCPTCSGLQLEVAGEWARPCPICRPGKKKESRAVGRKIYLASSWRNPHQPKVLHALRMAGHEVYDFRNPAPGNTGFAWSNIDPLWLGWSAEEFVVALEHSLAVDGFGLDWGAMQLADVGVLLLPSGRSAHLEAGYFVGAKKQLVILVLDKNEPELMYKMADAICLSIDGVLDALKKGAR